jgi:hypothetical protein
MNLLILLFMLQLKHYYADFVIQTYEQTIKKGIYGNKCGISHSFDHIWYSWVVLLIYSLFFHVSYWIVLILPLIEGIIHYHIDYCKVHYGTKDMKNPLFWNQFGLDQLGHQLTYIGMVWYLL